jgi:hypothetical protein
MSFAQIQPFLISVDFISNTSWGAIKTLAGMDEFRNLDRDIENNSKRWRKFVEAEAPEKEKFPQVTSFPVSDLRQNDIIVYVLCSAL